MGIRHQLAVYSPITGGAIVRGAVAAFGGASNARRQLRDLLLRDYSAQGAVLCASGTQALQLAICVARQGEGSDVPVALPAFSCFDVASAAVGADAPIALYDIDPITLGPDLDSLDRVLGGGVKVCVIAPLYGHPVDWEAAENIAARHGAILIEDGAQGHGATWRGQLVGALGDISILSFGRGKGWTGGAGGAVLFRRRPQNAPGLSDVGVRREATTALGLAVQWMLGRPSIYGIPRSIPALELGETTYHPPREPVCIARAAAASLLANRTASLSEAVARRATAQDFFGRLSGAKHLRTVEPTPGSDPGYLRLPLRLAGVSRRPVLTPRMRSLGIESSYPRPLGELPSVQRRLVGSERRWSGAAQLVRELITVPTHSRLSDRDRADLADALRTFDAHDLAASSAGPE